MAYVRKSKSRGKEYRQIVESYREDGKVKQRVLVHIGRFETPEEAAEWYERAAKMSGVAERFRREATQKRAKRERIVQWRKERGLPVPEHYTRPSWSEAKLLADADRYERQDAEHVRKAKTIRELIASGKIKPDTPEMRKERERRRQEGLARLRELETRLSRA